MTRIKVLLTKPNGIILKYEGEEISISNGVVEFIDEMTGKHLKLPLSECQIEVLG